MDFMDYIAEGDPPSIEDIDSCTSLVSWGKRFVFGQTIFNLGAAWFAWSAALKVVPAGGMSPGYTLALWGLVSGVLALFCSWLVWFLLYDGARFTRGGSLVEKLVTFSSGFSAPPITIFIDTGLLDKMPGYWLLICIGCLYGVFLSYIFKQFLKGASDLVECDCFSDVEGDLAPEAQEYLRKLKEVGRHPTSKEASQLLLYSEESCGNG